MGMQEEFEPLCAARELTDPPDHDRPLLPQTQAPIGNDPSQTTTPASDQLLPSYQLDVPTRKASATRSRIHQPKSTHKHGYFDYEKLESLTTPSLHDVVIESQSDLETKRNYDRLRQRRRLWRLSIGEFLITIMLCLAIFGLIFGYGRYEILNNVQKRIFNTMVTGLSVALGINLTASLRSYARMLKWRILAGKYRPLSQFELLMGAESQANVFKLLWTEFFRSSRRCKYLPSGTQLLCALWLLINLSTTTLVAMLGLTYSLEQSNTWIGTQRGPTLIVDWDACFDPGDAVAGFQAAQRAGLQTYRNAPPIDDFVANNEYSDGYESEGEGEAIYWAIDFNPQDTKQSVISNRYVSSTAACQAYPVIEGNRGYLDYLVYQDGTQTHKVNISGAHPGSLAAGGFPGGLLFMADSAETCGSRCTNLYVFQAESDPNGYDVQMWGVQATSVSKAQYFKCQNTVSEVQNVPDYDPADAYAMSDTVAWILAGASGWTGQTPDDDTWQYYVYDELSDLVQSPWSHATSSLSTKQLTNIIGDFTAAAMASANAADSRCTKVAYGDKPIFADYLNVSWLYAGLILGGIPALHFLSLLAVIMWANKAVIKDNTYLAAAKLYRPLIDRLGDHGCIMRGEHIIKKLNDPVVVYGWREVDEHTKHAGIFEQGQGVEIRPIFDPGVYDGGLRGS